MTNWQEHIDFILDEFDFDKVHQVMECLNWGWAGCDSPDGIPSIGDMRRWARRLLNEAATSESGYNASGGFAARRIDDDPPFLHLVFEVAEMGSELVDEQE